MNLQLQIETVEGICRLIESEKEYMKELTGYLPVLNQTISFILECAGNPETPFMINEEFVLQVLKDILYGMEHQDSVFLLDVLRHGLLEIFYYGKEGLQNGGMK